MKLRTLSKGPITHYKCTIVQKATLSGRQAVRWPGVPKVARSHLSQCSKSRDLQPALNCAIRGAQGGTALCRVGGATSQLDLPSLTPLSVAGYG